MAPPQQRRVLTDVSKDPSTFRGVLGLLSEVYLPAGGAFYSALDDFVVAQRPDLIVADLVTFGAQDLGQQHGIPVVINNPTMLYLKDAAPSYLPASGTGFPVDMSLTARAMNLLFPRLLSVALTPAFMQLNKVCGVAGVCGCVWVCVAVCGCVWLCVCGCVCVAVCVAVCARTRLQPLRHGSWCRCQRVATFLDCLRDPSLDVRAAAADSLDAIISTDITLVKSLLGPEPSLPQVGGHPATAVLQATAMAHVASGRRRARWATQGCLLCCTTWLRP